MRDKKIIDFLKKYEFLDKQKIINLPGKNEERRSLFCSFTYLTPNYYTLRAFKEIAQFSNNGFKVYLIQWDINALSTTYYKKMMPRNFNEVSPKKFMKDKRREIEEILVSFGGDIENIEVINSSELWKRFVQMGGDLFSNYFRVVSKLEVGSNEYKLKHLLQMPLEMFFINHFQKLCPEFPKESIDFALAIRDRKILYKKTREIMLKEGYLSHKKCILLGLKEVPFYQYEGYMPTWDMDINRTVEIISNCNYKKSDLKRLVECLRCYMPSVYYTDDGTKKACEPEELLEIVDSLDEREILESIAWNIYEFGRMCKDEYEKNIGVEKSKEKIIVSNKDEILEVGKVLRSKRMLEILDCINGEKSVSEIADELGIQLSNTSNYISKLQKAGFVESGNNKKIKKRVKNISVDISNI